MHPCGKKLFIFGLIANDAIADNSVIRRNDAHSTVISTHTNFGETFPKSLRQKVEVDSQGAVRSINDDDAVIHSMPTPATTCPPECRSSSCQTGGDWDDDARELINGVCTDYCSQKYSKTRYCGVGKIYTDGESFDCQACKGEVDEDYGGWDLDYVPSTEPQWKRKDDYEKDINHEWDGKPVPAGMNAIPKERLQEECQHECAREARRADPNTNSTGLGYCDFCGKGNACCRYNDALANADPTEMLPLVPGSDYLDGSPKPIYNKECTAVSDVAYKDKWGFVEQTKSRCVFAKEGIPSNYLKFKNEMMEKAFKLLSGAPQPSLSTVLPDPDTKQYPAGTKYAGSWYGAPDLRFDHPPALLQVDGPSTFVPYTRQTGRAPSSAYLQVGLLAEKLKDHDFLKDGTNPLAPGCCLPEWEQNCPAIGNSDYAIKRTELDGGEIDHIFYDRPYMKTEGTDIQVALYCGADYTDDHSNKTAIAAANMAKAACDDMGVLCGGFSVGTDPELCGNTGGVQVVFLNPQAASSTVDPRPLSKKTGGYYTNFFTWTKAANA